MTTILAQSTLGTMPPEVGIPTYDRSGLTTGIVHFGVGGFHRGHQAMFLDRLMNAGRAMDWAICGVGVLPADARMRDVMRRQDCLYTLVLKHPDGREEARVVGSIAEYLFAPDGSETVIERMAAPQTRIVSLTITEGGYNFNQNTGEFDADTPEVAHDLAGGEAPRTVFGLVVEALARRCGRGIAPFTIMSCDNIQGNGHVAKRMFASYAGLRDPGLGTWVQKNVHFPNSMVDRITPATTDQDRHDIRSRFGVEDGWPVVAEPFVQWVLEDDFGLGRPPYEDAGVQVVEDVEPFELMKLRLLNASHQGFCYFGQLAGHAYAHEVCQRPLYSGFLRAYMDAEATPTLQPVPGIDLDDYKSTLIRRFSNPNIRDTLARIGTDGSDRIPKFLLPVIRANLATGGQIDRSAAIVASWARYAEGTDERGHPIEVIDRNRDERIAAARKQHTDPLAFIRNTELFGDLAHNQRFARSYTAALHSLHTNGAAATLANLTQR